MDDFTDDLNRVLRYSRERLPVSAIHPAMRFSRLGAVLREHATEPSDIGELCHQAITSPHDQPLELMPLHLLRDKMQEEPEHPLASKFVWDKLPEKVQLDEDVRDVVRRSGHNYEHFRDEPAGRKSIVSYLTRYSNTASPGLHTDKEIQDSVRRCLFQSDASLFGNISRQMPDGTVYPDAHSYLTSPHYEDFRQRSEPRDRRPPDHY